MAPSNLENTPNPPPVPLRDPRAVDPVGLVPDADLHAAAGRWACLVTVAGLALELCEELAAELDGRCLEVGDRARIVRLQDPHVVANSPHDYAGDLGRVGNVARIDDSTPNPGGPDHPMLILELEGRQDAWWPAELEPAELAELRRLEAAWAVVYTAARARELRERGAVAETDPGSFLVLPWKELERAAQGMGDGPARWQVLTRDGGQWSTIAATAEDLPHGTALAHLCERAAEYEPAADARTHGMVRVRRSVDGGHQGALHAFLGRFVRVPRSGHPRLDQVNRARVFAGDEPIRPLELRNAAPEIAPLRPLDDGLHDKVRQLRELAGAS